MVDASSQIGLLLVNAIAGFFIFVVLLRFLLQAVRADFYNPISQFIVKASNPMLVPARKLIPGFGGYDLAAIAVLLVLELVAMTLSLLIMGWPLPIVNMLLWAVLGTIGLFFKLFFWGLLIMVIVSWIAPNNYNPAIELLKQIIEPLMSPIRKIMPDMGGMDISPIIAFLLINVFEIILVTFARQTGAPSFVIGL
jgi:YggT family protein